MRFLLKKSFSQINESGKKKAKFQIIEGHNNHIHQVEGVSPNGRIFHIKEKVTKIKNPMEHDDVGRLKEKLHNYEPSKSKSSKDKPKKTYKLKTVDIRNLLSDVLKMDSAKKTMSMKKKQLPVNIKKTVEIKKKPLKKEEIKKITLKKEVKKEKKPIKQKIEIKLKK